MTQLKSLLGCFVIALLFCSALKTSEGQEKVGTSLLPMIKPRNTARATVYDSEDGKGKKLSLTHESDLWYNLGKLKGDKLNKVSRVCVKGTWILYNQPDFVANSKKDVGILSGENACGNFKDLGEAGSIQPITLLSSRRDDALAFFPEKDFSGRVWTVDGSQSEARDTPLLQSVITLGKQEWTLVPTQGSPVCIAPQGTDKFPVCFISKLVDGTKIALGQFTKIRKGCATGTDRIAVHFCINYDSGKILRIDDLGAKMQGRALKTTGKNSPANQADYDSDEESSPVDSLTPACGYPLNKVPKTEPVDKEGMELIKIRLEHDIIGNENMLWPNNASNAWKVQLLERSFDIAFATCHIVPPPYLKYIRELFIYRWDKVAETNLDSAFPVETYQAQWDDVNMLLGECILNVQGDFAAELSEEVLTLYHVVSDDETLRKSLDPILRYRENYDYVIDTVWLVANHVAATCHHALKFSVNFWSDYIELFQSLYLNPVESLWSDPGKMNNAYKFALGGYGIERMYNKLGICTTASNLLVDNLDPFTRLIDLVDAKK